MARDIESRLALQAARGIRALQLADELKSLALDAQAARDDARLRFTLANDQANTLFASAVLRAMDQYASQILSLAIDEDDYGEEEDE